MAITAQAGPPAAAFPRRLMENCTRGPEVAMAVCAIKIQLRGNPGEFQLQEHLTPVQYRAVARRFFQVPGTHYVELLDAGVADAMSSALQAHGAVTRVPDEEFARVRAEADAFKKSREEFGGSQIIGRSKLHVMPRWYHCAQSAIVGATLSTSVQNTQLAHRTGCAITGGTPQYGFRLPCSRGGPQGSGIRKKIPWKIHRGTTRVQPLTKTEKFERRHKPTSTLRNRPTP